jgi:hypothetical protein
MLVSIVAHCDEDEAGRESERALGASGQAAASQRQQDFIPMLPIQQTNNLNKKNEKKKISAAAAAATAAHAFSIFCELFPSEN